MRADEYMQKEDMQTFFYFVLFLSFCVIFSQKFIFSKFILRVLLDLLSQNFLAQFYSIAFHLFSCIFDF